MFCHRYSADKLRFKIEQHTLIFVLPERQYLSVFLLLANSYSVGNKLQLLSKVNSTNLQLNIRYYRDCCTENAKKNCCTELIRKEE